MIDKVKYCLVTEDPDCVYLPSDEEIYEQCEEIRSRWSEYEYQKRSHIKPLRWTAPIVSVCVDPSNLTDD